MTMTREQFMQAFAKERADYGRSLGGRIAGMQLLWQAVCAGAAARDDLARLERTAHSLAGSGPLFGYDDLGLQARLLETDLHRLVAEGAAVPANRERAAIRDRLAVLKRCIRENQ